MIFMNGLASHTYLFLALFLDGFPWNVVSVVVFQLFDQMSDTRDGGTLTFSRVTIKRLSKGEGRTRSKELEEVGRELVGH